MTNIYSEHRKCHTLAHTGEVGAVIDFVDENGDGSVTIDELILGVRRSRRMNSTLLADGKKLLRRLLDFLGIYIHIHTCSRASTITHSHACIQLEKARRFRIGLI